MQQAFSKGLLCHFGEDGYPEYARLNNGRTYSNSPVLDTASVLKTEAEVASISLLWV